jgi:hypothetical protein
VKRSNDGFFNDAAKRSENMTTGKEKIRQTVITISFLTVLFINLFFLIDQTKCFAATVALHWDAVTDTNVAGYKVRYQADSSTQPFTGSTAPLDVKNQTTATISGLDPAHAYYFAVTTYNSAGAESSYSNIVAVPELVPPTVSLRSPTTNMTLSGTVAVSADASDNVGVTKVEYYVNGVLLATDTATPYVYSWNTSSLAAGSYTLMAKAYDAAGNVGQSPNVVVSVVKDATAPTVSLTAPANNATVNGTVLVTASASDNVGLSWVEFYRNGVLLSVTNLAPYSYSWNSASVTDGSYTLTAKAYDAAGNVGQSSNVVVTVSNSSVAVPNQVTDTIAPTVSITSPVDNATVLGNVTVAASASDNVGVKKVEFYVNGVLKATKTTAPYTFKWNTRSFAKGTYTLTAKAYDAANNVGSKSITLYLK